MPSPRRQTVARVFLLSTVLFGCTPVSPPVAIEGPYPRTVVPRPDVRAEQTLQTAESVVADVVSTTPKVGLLPGETLVRLINANLDLDTTDEQILILRSQAGSPIRIAVVDHDEIRDQWARTTQYTTQTTNERAFQIQTEDIIGDHSLEIVAEGLDSSGASTLDVLRRTTSPAGSGLYYTPIMQVTADRSITVRRQSRPESYHFAQKHDQPFPIVIERTDPDDPDGTDVLRETYHWIYNERRYVKQVSERIRPEELVQHQLQQLFSSRSSQADYESFLDGPWYKKNDVNTLVVFEPRDGLIAFYDGEVQELYRVTFLNMRGYRLSIRANNTSLHTIEKWITVVIQTHDVLSVAITGDRRFLSPTVRDPWEGEYYRLTPDLQRSVVAGPAATPGPSPVSLSGIYGNGAGVEIAFESPYFTWLSQDKVESGGYVVTGGVPLLNTHYLERETPQPLDIASFKFIEQSSVSTRDETYLLEYAEEIKNSVVIRTIQLTPATLTIQGALATATEPLILEQIETVDTETHTDQVGP